jgi:hypothetical protein
MQDPAYLFSLIAILLFIVSPLRFDIDFFSNAPPSTKKIKENSNILRCLAKLARKTRLSVSSAKLIKITLTLYESIISK